MGLSSLFTALLSTYQEWGVLASILLAVLRFLQGVSLGGEFGGGIVLTAEFAEANRRAFWVAIAQTAQGTGPLLANGLIALLLVLLTPTQYALIGWRILFGIGALIAVIGVIIRLKIAESPIFSNIKNKGEITRIPIAEAFSKYWKRILIGLGFIVGGTTITYATGVFASSYLQTFIHVPPLQVSLALVIGYTAIAIFSPIFGMLSDKIGRKPFMITSAVLLIAFVYPYFILISTGQFSLIALAQFIIGLIGSIYNGPYAATMSEMFPTRVRYSALSFDYHVGVAVFGGTTPFIATYLIYVTHYQLSPALYGIAGMVVTLIAYVLAPETKGTNLDKVVI
jgi:MHS family proline/betaine transporter-like MFS transporter